MVRLTLAINIVLSIYIRVNPVQPLRRDLRVNSLGFLALRPSLSTPRHVAEEGMAKITIVTKTSIKVNPALERFFLGCILTPPVPDPTA